MVFGFPGLSCALLVSPGLFWYVLVSVWIPLVTLSYDAFIYIYIYSSSIIYTYLLLYIIYIYSFIYVYIAVSILAQGIHCRNACYHGAFAFLVPLLFCCYAIHSCCCAPMIFEDCMVLWSFHFLVHLLLCCYAIHSCWCTPMTSGHALVVSVSISQWWQLSMKLFFRFSSLLFPIVCNIYARRDWMPSCPCERVYALWCFSVAFGMLHILWYQPGIWHITSTVRNYSFVFE